jgi:hypothetical protein
VAAARLGAAIATVIRPATWRHFTSGSVGGSALNPRAWHQITQRAAAMTSA